MLGSTNPEMSEYALIRTRKTRTVVVRFPKNDGPPKNERQPRGSEGIGVFFPFGLLIGAGAMKGTIPRTIENVMVKGILFRMMLVAYKKAFLKYAPLTSFTAGLELLGTEVKALRSKLGSLEGARVVVRGGEAFIVGMTIPPYQMANTNKGYDPERARRLLLTKNELAELAAAEAKKGLTIVPIEVYTIGKLIKVRIAIVRGKGKEDRREDLKKRDALREAGRMLKR